MPDQTTGDREEGKGDAHLNGIKGTSILNYGSKSPEFPLRHYADQRISLDLDDGVKVNYGKFGNLLSEVKAVTGGEGLTKERKKVHPECSTELVAGFLLDKFYNSE